MNIPKDGRPLVTIRTSDSMKFNLKQLNETYNMDQTCEKLFQRYQCEDFFNTPIEQDSISSTN